MNIKKTFCPALIATLILITGCNYQNKTLNWQPLEQHKIKSSAQVDRVILLTVADNRSRQSLGVSWENQQAELLQLQQDLTVTTNQLLSEALHQQGLVARMHTDENSPQVRFELEQFEYKNQWPFFGGQASVVIKATVTIRKGDAQKAKLFQVTRPVANDKLSESLYETYQEFLLSIAQDKTLQAFLLAQLPAAAI